jgi:hypothetical protein
MTNAPQNVETKCRICGREGDGELCRYHKEACAKITKHYGVWRERRGIRWKEYLKELSVNELAGVWVKEAAMYLLNVGAEEAKAP